MKTPFLLKEQLEICNIREKHETVAPHISEVYDQNFMFVLLLLILYMLGL